MSVIPILTILIIDMKRWFLYLVILVIPFLGMVVLNEVVRVTNTDVGYKQEGFTAINSGKKIKSRCSWACHNDTNFCKRHHVKLVGNYFEYTDPMYFGVIRSLQSTGNYGLANIVFLVVLIPAVIYFLLVKSIDMQREINGFKREERGDF